MTEDAHQQDPSASRDDAPSGGEASGAPSPELIEEARRDPHLRAALDEVDRLRDKVEEEKQKRKKGKQAAKDESLGTSRGIETMFRTSYRTHMDLSSIADNKANIMISINGIIISIMLASISPKIDANPLLLVPTTVLLVGCVAAIVYAVLAARPRVTSHVVSLEDVRANRANILFFGNFVSMSQDDFVEGMSELMRDTDRVYVNMARDIYSLGGVLAKKFRLLRTSYTIFMYALALGVLLYIAVFAASATPGGGVSPMP
ncbi:MAG TPA: Pycsar system effector family protein [Longimicrobiales bacterium]|jgi:hypothetical protein